MEDHGWIDEVLTDILNYSERNGLRTVVEPLLAARQAIDIVIDRDDALRMAARMLEIASCSGISLNVPLFIRKR